MPKTVNVSVNDLKQNMKILEFTEFTNPYSQMEAKMVKFVQHNLKGASAQVQREGKVITCPIAKLQSGDSILKVFDIPKELSKLTHVTRGLIPELKKRGFVGFTIEAPEKVPSSAQEKRKKSVEQANAFIQSMQKNIRVRKDAIDLSKHMLDKARHGKPNATAIKRSIDKIFHGSSPEALTAIACLQKSDQTYAHCIDTAAIFQTAYFAIKKKTGQKSVFASKSLAAFGAFMHDFGKAKVPKDILESTDRFERGSREMEILQGHPVFGAELLSNMDMPAPIVNMAHYHHVKMDSSLNSSYPKEVNYEDVIMETRLISIVDVYQALIGRRSYKKSWAPPAAMRYIDALAGAEFDEAIWEDFVRVMGMYPKASLVELSDQNMGFVMNVPDEDLERPQVVIFRDAAGKDIAKPHLIDLMDEPELEIEQDLDPYEVLGENAMDIFLRIEVS